MAVDLDTEFGLGAWVVGQAQDRSIRRHQPETAPARFRPVAFEQRQHVVVECYKGRVFQLQSRLAQPTLRDGASILARKRLEQLVKQDLEATLEGAQQERHQDRESEDALAGKCLGIHPMAGDKSGLCSKSARQARILAWALLSRIHVFTI